METKPVVNEELIRKAAEKTADLWVEQMQKPFNKDNGDDNPFLFMLSSMATRNAQDCLSPTALGLFKTELVARIVAQFVSDPTRQSFALYTDYHPDRMLAESAQMAGIEETVFPWKSAVRIYLADNKIEYSFGYGKPHHSITIE